MTDVSALPQGSSGNSTTSIVAEIKRDLSIMQPVKAIEPQQVAIRDDALSSEMMNDMIFENLGGRELISISRNDLINGQSVQYQPIKNATSISSKYNPQNLLMLAGSADSYFKNFPIKLDSYIRDFSDTQAEIDEDGNLVIYLVNVPENEQVQVQIFSSLEVLNDTIY